VRNGSSPAEPFAVKSCLAQRVLKTLSSLLVGPIAGVAVKDEILESTRYKMVGNEPGGMSIVLEHASKLQMRPAKAEIHSRFFRFDHEIRQLVSDAQPGQNAIAAPTPRQNVVVRERGRKVPAMLQGIALDAPVQAGVVPTQGNKDPLT